MRAQGQAIAERLKEATGMEYLDRLPAAIQPGKVLVHNRAQSAQSLGMNGFRAWLVDAADRRHALREVCDCGWAPELGPHYRRVSQMEEH
jgi:hypothetical protein